MLTSLERIISTGPAVALLLALFVISQSWIIVALGDTGKELAKLQTACLIHPGYNATGEAARAILKEWTVDDIQNFRRHFLIDFWIHPILYALFFTSALLYHLTHDERSKDDPKSVLYGRIGTLLVFCGAFCDIAENIRHSSIDFDDSSHNFASNDTLWQACAFASTKWVIMGGVAGWLSWRCSHTPSSGNSKLMGPSSKDLADGLGDSWVGPRASDFLNTPCEAGLLNIQGRNIPWTLSTPGSRHDIERSYTVSPYAHYIGYGLDEIQIHLANRTVFKLLAETIVETVGFMFHCLSFDSSIYFNNQLLSTNLWPTTIAWSQEQVTRINNDLKSQAAASGDSNRAIVWRSVDKLSQPKMTRILSESPSCLLIPARVVNWSEFEGDFISSDMYNRKDFQRDMKLFQKQVGWDIAKQENVDGWQNSKYTMMNIPPEHLTLKDATAIVDLFHQLYINKYSRRNPQLTPEGLIRMATSGFFRVDVLRMRTNSGESNDNLGRIVGFCTWSTSDDVTNSSFVGYDIEGDTDGDLYRLVMMMIHSNLVESGLSKCHMSGGANRFKRRRGAQSTIEYNAVFVDHLPFYQQIPWKLVKLVADKIITVERAK